MALEESPTPLGELPVQAREAHLLRTRGRIDYWRGQRAGEPSDGLKSLALEELGKYERQLREPYTKRVLRASPVKAEGPVAAAWTAMQARLAELEAKLAKLVGITDQPPSDQEPTS